MSKIRIKQIDNNLANDGAVILFDGSVNRWSNSDSSSILASSGTTAERPSTPINGQFRYNEDINSFEFYQGSAWVTYADTISGGNAFTTIAVSGQSPVEADTSTDTVTFIAGDNITITTDPINDIITFDVAPDAYFDWTAYAFTGNITGDVLMTPDQANDTLNWVAGSGIAITTNNTTDTITLSTIDQNLWATINADTGSTTANNSSDTLTIVGGTGISTAISGDTLTIINELPDDPITVQHDAVDVDTDTSTFNFTGQVLVTQTAPGTVEVDIAPGLSTLTGLSAHQLTGADAVLSEPLIFTSDTVRGKILSQETFNFTFASNTVNNDDWMPATHVADALSGLIMPYDATLIRATGHCADTGTNTKDFYTYHDTTQHTTIIGTLSGGIDVEFYNTDLNLDFAAGEKLRLRGGPVGGHINDTLITIWLKWRYTGA